MKKRELGHSVILADVQVDETDGRGIDLIWGAAQALQKVLDRRTFRNMVILEHFWKHSAQTEAGKGKRLCLLRTHVHCGMSIPDADVRSARKSYRRASKPCIGRGYRCWICSFRSSKANPLQWHHVIPIADGGISDRINLVPLCVDCHKNVHRREDS